MSALLEAVEARGSGGRAALAHGGGTLSYAELAELARVRAAELAARLEGGNLRVALVAADPVRTAADFLAASSLGATVVLVDASSPEAELKRIVARAGTAVVLGPGPSVGSADPPRAETAPEREPGVALVTSGVTGRPRVVERDWPSVAANARSFADALGLTDGDAVLCTTPLHHSYAFCGGLLAALQSGATYVAPPLPTTPGALSKAWAAAKATVLLSVPLLYRWYVESPPLEPRPRLAISAGERLPAEVAERWRTLYGRPLCNHYGTSETGMISVDFEGVPDSVGRPLPGVEVRIDGSDGGMSGEILVRGPGGPPLVLGDEPESWPEAGAGEWFRTGDIGHLDREGRLFVEGRRALIINVGGNKVGCAEVEDVIREDPAVRDCAVVADESKTPVRICAFVESSGDFDSAGLRRRLGRQLAPFKVPAVIRGVESLPRTPSGKIRRAELLDLL